MGTQRLAAPPRSEQFTEAYDAVLARWPIPVEAIDLSSDYGTAHVNACGPADAPPLVLLHGGGATSTVWFANVEALGAAHRVYAVDTIGDAGRSVHDGKPIKTPADLMDWLDTVRVGLGLESADFCGHSYGAWLSLSYALHAPNHVRKLALLDPTKCFVGYRPRYLVRAAPVILWPSAQRTRDYLAWETGNAPLDPEWVTLSALGTEFPKSKVVVGPTPKAEQLRALTNPTLVVLAERSKAHDIRRVGDAARATVANVTVTTLQGASHHTIPSESAAELNRQLVEFLG